MMDNNHLLNNLNPQQRQAVTTDNQYTLLLAGSGTGKTRTLVHRIAWLCAVKKVPPYSILALTFTNKAATEMGEKIKRLLGEHHYQGMWVSTFHAAAHRLLRIFYKQAKLADHFQLIDTDDQIRLLKSIMRELNDQTISPREIAEFINKNKENGLRPNDVSTKNNKLKIYAIYHQNCEQAGYVDFSELIFRAYELLKYSKEALNYCHLKFTHILIDEFQDINAIEFKLIKKLAGETNTIMIAGDDDQSIYGWRGANANNLQNFIEEYPQTTIIRLQQNYRSTGSIINAANHVIKNNQQRLSKKLWTNEDNGELVNIYMGFNEIDEARYVANQIKLYKLSGGHYAHCAILYRNSAQSRALEDVLLQTDIPYQIYGSISFYERQEIKKALAYLRLLHDPHNDMAFDQVVNTPTRGIGSATLATIHHTAKQQNSLWKTANLLLENHIIKAKPKTGLIRFIELIETMRDELSDLPLHEQLSRIIHDTGLYEMYKQEQSIKSQSRLENLEQLISNAQSFDRDQTTDENLINIDKVSNQTLGVLERFLAYTTLEGKENVKNTDAVQMMTLHASKGLEFINVYIVGMEEGLFPDERAVDAHKKDDHKKMEEERRLMYVGMTRARKRLTLSFCQNRYMYNKSKKALPSKFLTELPKEWINSTYYRDSFRIKPTLKYNNTILDNLIEDEDTQINDKKINSVNIHLGQRVRHHRFGEGTIINVDGEGDYRRVQVAFTDKGIKWLVLKLANLEMI